MAKPRTIIVTGASAGVGRSVARRFARAGDRVGLIARDPKALEEVRRELVASGAEAASAPADVADAEQIAAAAASIEEKLGPVDIWINDAMETVFSRVADMSPAEFRRVTEVTYLGFVYGSMTALKSMQARGQGRIIQIGSALAYRGIPLQGAYCGAKHAIRGFTDSLRAELFAEGSRVTVSIVELPAVNTPQFDWARAHIERTPRPMGRPIEPEVAADAVYRAAAGDWREYWLGLPTIFLIIADFLLPGALDRYLAATAIEGQQTSTPMPLDRPDNLERPVTALHRMRGSFGAEAQTSAPLVVGELARLGAAAAGGLVFFAAGAAFVAMRYGNRRSGRRLRANDRRAA
jgi:NAD(P)-dependent dehydrogenase (short-subunit alcohol dehydrogenase family)